MVDDSLTTQKTMITLQNISRNMPFANHQYFELASKRRHPNPPRKKSLIVSAHAIHIYSRLFPFLPH